MMKTFHLQSTNSCLSNEQRFLRSLAFLSKVGMFLIACSLFSAPAFANFATCEQPNLLILLDRSGSMNKKPSGSSKTKWGLAEDAIKSVSNAYDRKMRFALITFASNGYPKDDDSQYILPNSAALLHHSFARCISDDNASQTKGCVYYLQQQVELMTNNTYGWNDVSYNLVQGNTDTKAAFQAASSHLTTTKNADAIKNRKTSIMFISDGEDTINPKDSQGRAYCPESLVQALYQNDGVKTYVVGFGSDVDTDCLNRLAVAGGTAKSGTIKYYQANNSTELNNVTKEIADSTAKEVCNNLDDDCDGQIDEGITQSCTTACGSGTQTCSGGNWGVCSSGNPEPETCDNTDEDCDGKIDDNLTRSCSTACGSGSETCIAGQWKNCTATKPVTEVCDGIDNDCDGSVDENWSNKGQSCSVGQGECKRTGNYQCKSDKSGIECSVQPGPTSTEICDGKDNDCDGVTDENFLDKGVSCTVGTGECKNTGTKVCKANGSGTECSVKPGKATTEVCDGLDNNCDGQVDENFGQKGLTCTVGLGICKNQGVYKCRGDKLALECSVQPKPKETEICDGKDNDCDGQTDENWPNLGKVCKVGTGGCASNALYKCKADGSDMECPTQAQTPSAETCDGIDNDCDGKTDNVKNTTTALTQSCYTGLGSTQNKGLCKDGTQTCTNGNWSTCVNEVLPSTEVCDGKDNDCDGQTDEDWANKGKTCSVGTGGCKKTATWTCKSDLSGIECPVKAKQATKEVCDGIDNDCDGKTDNIASSSKPLEKSCYTGTANTQSKGLCKDGTQTCTNGNWSTCVNEVLPSTEVCDGKDNDCDGQTDEDFPNKGGICKKGVGSCEKTARWTCSTDGKKLECPTKEGTPSTDVCDGKDNDCDGKIDNQAGKSDSLTRSCYNGKSGTDGKGLCKKGTQTCNAGQWSKCAGEVIETTDVCDGKDNDCDGQTDEDFPKIGKDCEVGIGACKNTSKYECHADGTKVWCPIQPKRGDLELCDDKDNDCDGKVDEELKKSCKSDCGSGKQVCTSGKWSACDAPKPKTETCNNKDDDCDGTIDNGLKQECTSVCGKGEETCVQGSWVFCSAPQPKIEICDGKDNDCNGQTDDLAPKKCDGACGQGTATCTNGKWSGCSGPQPEPEVCDGKDNDCNGKIDENLEKKCKTDCGDGKEVCDSGIWKTCTAIKPQKEICDGKDNDCNGKADDGKLCESGKICHKAACRKECPFGECERGFRCEGGVCIGDVCKDMKCPTGEVCVGGQCHDICKTVTCRGDQVCKQGKCLEDNCYANGCPSGQTCIDGKCKSDPCDGVTCASDEFCREGNCIKSCANVTCASDEICKDGNCEKNPCDKVKCKAGYHCGKKGVCEKDPCHGVQCPSGRKCVEGKCGHDDCWNIKCPSGETCKNNQCTKDKNPSENPGKDEEINGTSEKNNADDTHTNDASDKKEVVEENPSTPQPDKNAQPDGGSTNPNKKDLTPPQDGGSNNNNQGDGDGPVGCNCDASGPQGSSLFLMFLFFFFFIRTSGRKQ